MSEPLSDPPPDPLSGNPDCPACGSLPRSYLARTGYGEYLPPAAGKLHGFEIDSGRDVRRCPVCDAFFDWGGVRKEWWLDTATNNTFGWNVDPTSLVIENDTIFRDRYHVFMLKNGKRETR